MAETEKKQVPEINLSDNKVIEQLKKVPIIVNGEEVFITMRKLPIGEKQGLVKSSAQTKMVGTQVTGNIDSVGYQIGLLSKVIIDAPFPTDEAGIRALDENVVDYLYSEYDEWASNKKKV